MAEQSVVAQVRSLHRMSLPGLQQAWLEAFGEETKSRDRDYLWRRIAAKRQDNIMASLSDEDRATVERYRDEFRRTPPDQWFPGTKNSKARKTASRPTHDRRIPPPGSVISHTYRGQEVAVTVLEKGFDYQGSTYRSLSAVAREITGTGWNGFTFFGLNKGAGR